MLQLKTRHLQSLFLVLCSVFIFQYGSLKAQSLQLTTLTEEDGLSYNYQWSTNAICEDSFGYVWFATLSGLDRYDGYELKSYRGILGDERDLPYNRITAIAEGFDGDLVLGTEEEGLIFFDRKSELFTPVRQILVDGDSLTLGQINAIRKKGDNELIIATAFSGIYAYDLKEKSFESVPINHPAFTPISTNNIEILKNGSLLVVSNNGVFIEKKNGSYDYFNVEKKFYLKYVIELDDDNVLVRTHNTNDEFLLNRSTLKVSKIKSSNQNLSCTGTMDTAGNLWLNNNNGELFKKNEGVKGKFRASVKRKGVDFPICMTDMHVSDNGRVFFMSNVGAGSFEFNDPIISPFFEDEIKIFQVFNGEIHFAVGSSLYKWSKGEKKLLLQLPPPFRNNQIYNFHKDVAGNYWVGHRDEIGAGTIFDSKGKELGQSYFSALSPQYIELAGDHKFTIGNQVFQEQEKTKKYKFIGDLYREYTGQKYPDYRVKYYKQLRNNEIWICTFSDGIYIIDREQKEVSKLEVDTRGNGKLKSDNPYYLYEHSSGKVFVATEVGIHIWDPESTSFEYLEERIENKGRRVKSMGEDKEGNLWVLNSENLRSYDLIIQTVKEFALGSSVFVDFEEPRDMHLLENGEFLFQGFHRVYTFSPKKLISESVPNKVVFSDLYVSRKKVYPSSEGDCFNTSLLFANQFSLPYASRNVGFSFVSIDGKSKNVSYFYRLLGEGEEWIETKDEREVYFSNLSPGDYVFEVKARGGNGLWTKETSQVFFTITPPWYLSWYAYVLYALAALAVIYGIYRVRINQLLKYQDLRIKVSSDLHDDVGSLLTGISMKAQILGLGKKGDEKESLGELSSLSHSALDQMRDIVWALDARKDSIQDLKQRMLTYAQENLSLKSIKYDFDFKSYAGINAINPEQRQNLYYIFKEAITNILKHSDANHVNIKLQKGPLGSKLIIHDNGSYNRAESRSGQGLSNIEMRANRLGGQAYFERENGFKVTVAF